MSSSNESSLDHRLYLRPISATWVRNILDAGKPKDMSRNLGSFLVSLLAMFYDLPEIRTFLPISNGSHYESIRQIPALSPIAFAPNHEETTSLLSHENNFFNNDFQVDLFLVCYIPVFPSVHPLSCMIMAVFRVCGCSSPKFVWNIW